MEERRIHRWHDRMDITVAMVITIGAVIGWLHSDWKLSTQMESVISEIIPMVKADHERIIRLEDAIVKK